MFLILHDVSKLSATYFSILDPTFLSVSPATHMLLLGFLGTPPFISLFALPRNNQPLQSSSSLLLYLTGDSSCKVTFPLHLLICVSSALSMTLCESTCLTVICGCLCPFPKIMKAGSMVSSSSFPGTEQASLVGTQ